MGMAQAQDVPIKTEEKSEWSMRRLFPFKASVNALVKTFINPFEILLGFSILVIGICEVIGRNVSWQFYALAFFILVAACVERYLKPVEIGKSSKKEEPKP